MPVGWTSDGPPDPAHADAYTAALRLETVSSSSGLARRFTREQLDGIDPATLHTVLLVATELVTNAVLHAQGPIDLTLAVTNESVLVQVFDCEAVLPTLRPYDVDRTDGRGIALVAMVSREWGTRLHDGGKTVWAVVDRAEPVAG